ncbi:hypothetical protein GH723_07575 [Actinomarinicola tropica]|uniref:SLH domain-containing protein n=1 Tax=Actinomarinicola tropica TaxID=2789776 RepID=A0A5Q2RDK4_9ACTN|nr:hypothetical protein GH723_07575 [Actinomarinicola tropica]
MSASRSTTAPPPVTGADRRLPTVWTGVTLDRVTIHRAPGGSPRRRRAAVALVVAICASVLTGPPAGAAFPDVPPGAFYSDGVAWLEAAGHTTGVGSTGLFLPDRVVTRAEAATFLWRIEGSPPAPLSGFADVPTGAYYARAVGWLRQAGLTTGVGGSNLYAPNAPVTRAELTTLLWRHAERPAGSPTPFPDVQPRAFYTQAVEWMVQTRLTTGVGCTGLFQPHAGLTRGTLATFLHRYAGLVGIRPGGYTPPPPARCAPSISVTTVMSGLQVPWGVDTAPDDTLVVTERPGRLRVRLPNGVQRQLAANFGDLRVSGETGLMGVVVDPDFATNRRIYTCQGHTSGDVRVYPWTIDPGWTTATRQPVLVSGMPGSSSGRHGGCQLEIAPDGRLLIGTGDAAQGTNPQDVTSLGGKVLRVDRATGEGAAGNPFLGSANADTRRIYTYGHRNVQGLALRPGSGQIFSVEHGPTRDDEINLLQAGVNYGWNPVPGYNESVPMTHAGARPAVWSSGALTLATSGADFLRGSRWGSWGVGWPSPR